MFDFNWGVFWAVLAAFSVRGILRVIWHPVAQRDKERRERAEEFKRMYGN